MDPNRFKTSRYPVNHKIKSHPEPFAAVWSGTKGNEIRINDRGYRVSDAVRLMEYNPDQKTFTGRTIDLIITHLRFAEGEGLPVSAGLKPGYVIWDFLIVNQFTKADNDLFNKEDF